MSGVYIGNALARRLNVRLFYFIVASCVATASLLTLGLFKGDALAVVLAIVGLLTVWPWEKLTYFNGPGLVELWRDLVHEKGPP